MGVSLRDWDRGLARGRLGTKKIGSGLRSCFRKVLTAETADERPERRCVGRLRRSWDRRVEVTPIAGREIVFRVDAMDTDRLVEIVGMC